MRLLTAVALLLLSVATPGFAGEKLKLNPDLDFDSEHDGLFEIDIHSHARGVPTGSARGRHGADTVVAMLQRTCRNAHGVV